ncbi:MAG: protein kinase domain-containing protein [Solirubrobacteraceae bacterium]
MSLSAATPRAPDLSGCALQGRYELHALIGEGTFGRVYRGRDRRLARPVAVKVIKPWWAEDPDWARSFEREAQLMASVSDPRIVQIFDVGHAEEGLYYVAELVPGESVAVRLRRGPLPAWEAREVAEQLSRALASAHARRVVHGDVKPANVLASPRGEVKVTDFGLARLLGGSSGEVGATVAGTPSYMAPEQARGRGTTPASDVYSVGVVLYEMLAGHTPFSGDSAVDLALRHLQDPPPPLPSSAPAALTAIVERALAKDPDDRYRDGAELADALTRTRGSTRKSPPAFRTSSVGNRVERPPPRGPAGTLVAPKRSPRRNVNPAARRRTLAAFSVALLFLLGLVAAAILTGGARQVTVPDLHGLTPRASSTRLTKAHLRIVLHRRYSHHGRRGTVIGQQPAPGAHVASGGNVTVTLSAGPPPVPVPRVVGFSSGDARSALRQLGLRVSLNQVPAPGVRVGTVTAQHPSSGVKLLPGSTVSLSVAEPPRWRAVVTFNDRGGEFSSPFRIRGTHWRFVYSMSYSGTCTFIFFCSGPSAQVTDVDRGSRVGSFDLSDGSNQVQDFHAGPGVYQVRITPGNDSAHWSVEVEDYY